MGYSVSGQLSFGINIGNEEDNYGFEEDKTPNWAQSESPIEEAERLLYQSIGFDDDLPLDERGSDFYVARRQAQYKLGVKFQLYGVADYTSWMLVGLHVQASDGGPVTITEADLTLPEGMMKQLEHASKVLGLEDRKPRWMLTGLYF
jgi:hypothetical protein